MIRSPDHQIIRSKGLLLSDTNAHFHTRVFQQKSNPWGNPAEWMPRSGTRDARHESAQKLNMGRLKRPMPLLDLELHHPRLRRIARGIHGLQLRAISSRRKL